MNFNRNMVAGALTLVSVCFRVAPVVAQDRPLEADPAIQQDQLQVIRADSLARVQNHAAAIGLAHEALGTVLDRTEDKDTLAILWLNKLGIYFYQTAQYDSAEFYWRRSLRATEDWFGNDHPSVAKSLNNLAVLHRDKGNYSLALPLYLRALEIWEHAYGPDHQLVATAANNLGYCYHYLGRYDDARVLYERALAGWTKAYGAVHHDVARAIINLANLARDLGRFAEAERRLRDALNTMQHVYQTAHPDIAYCLNNLAFVCWKQARYDDAKDLYRQALAINEKSLGPNHPYVAYSLHGLAKLEIESRDYPAAESLLLRALAVRRETFGNEHVEVATIENDLAAMYLDYGRREPAGQLVEHALTIRERAYGPVHSDVANSLYTLATLRQQELKPRETESLTTQAVAVWEKCLGKSHDNVAAGLELLAQLALEKGQPEDGLDAALRACAIRLRNFRANGMALSERDALAFGGSLRQSLDLTLEIYFGIDVPSRAATETVCDLILGTKGMVTDQLFEQRQLSRVRQDTLSGRLTETLRRTKFRLSELYAQGQSDDAVAYSHATDSLSKVAEGIEQELALLGGSFPARSGQRPVTTLNMRQALPQASVMMEFIRYRHRHAEYAVDGESYAVIVLRPDDPEMLVRLGPADSLHVLINEYRRQFSAIASGEIAPDSRAETTYRRIAQSLSDFVWRPIARYVKPGERLFLACDGALNLVSFASLPVEDDRYLIDIHPVHYLSSGRDILRPSARKKASNRLLVIGDPDYFAWATESTGRSVDTPRAIQTPGVRGQVAPCVTLENLVASPLPGTRREVETIAEQWSRGHGNQITMLLGAEASEEQVVASMPSAGFIHIATHGFFLSDTCLPNWPASRLSALAPTARLNPLLLSGLLLAGVNNRTSGSGSGDGILTAYEVSALDLDATRLVFLSACESGAGQLVDGEGVYGLRRAFQMAGASTVVSSLWPVSDELTGDLVAWFYENRSSVLPDRMRDLQVRKLNELRRSNRPTHPYLWAGFIAVGDWR
ncbi:MAG: CHAT domain-containing tetratricopeptide repeat protein [Candidatus Zixiibacteriota bacterium]